MAIITDPTQLMNGNLDTASTAGDELTIDTAARTIKLNPGAVGSDIPDAADGVTFQALYSAMKLLWKNSSEYIKFPFPFEAITPEQYEVINGWTFLDATTRKAIRTAGWAEKNSAGDIVAMYAGIVSLGILGASDQPYFQQDSGTGAATNFSFPGPVNEAVQILDDPNGDGSFVDGFDRRAYFKLFAREEQKTYAAAVLADIGVTTMSTLVYRFPLSNGGDLKALVTDAALIADTDTYGAIDVEYFGTPQSRSIGGSSYDFDIIIDGAGKSAEEIYTKIQYLLRQNSDIDAGAGNVIGQTADALLRFVGDTLITSEGVYIDNFDSNDTNRITFTDDTGTARTFPFVAAGTLTFNPNLVNDPSAVYRMYFTTNPGGNFGSASAILVNDSGGTPISGTVTGASIPFDFSYDSNVQGGRTAGQDASVTVVAIGLTTGQYVTATASIGRATGQTIALTAALERNFSNA